MIRGGIAIVLTFTAMLLVQIRSAPVAAMQAENAGAAQAAQGPAQPIPFSHKIHAGTAKLPCETCHELSKSGLSLTIPQSKLCMQCHQTIAADKPDVQRLAALNSAGQPISWVRIYATPSFVRFSHKMHLDHNNSCKECHGDVATRDQLFKETDISMAGCISCHNAKKASTGCDTCHTLEQSEFRAPRFGRGVPTERRSRVPFWRVSPLS